MSGDIGILRFCQIAHYRKMTFEDSRKFSNRALSRRHRAKDMKRSHNSLNSLTNKINAVSDNKLQLTEYGRWHWFWRLVIPIGNHAYYCIAYGAYMLNIENEDDVLFRGHRHQVAAIPAQQNVSSTSVAAYKDRMVRCVHVTGLYLSVVKSVVCMNLHHLECASNMSLCIVMAALHSRCGHYIFAL